MNKLLFPNFFTSYMNFKQLPVEINEIIDSYCFEKCKYCQMSTTNFNFCSSKCFNDYHSEFVDFLDFLIVFISFGLIVYNLFDYIIEPFNVMLIIFVYGILIPSWIISNISGVSNHIINKRSLKVNLQIS